ncbi:hypothetical protein [Alsobacter sp. SYSU BS001988]|jgi:hypothetical protein
MIGPFASRERELIMKLDATVDLLYAAIVLLSIGFVSLLPI